MDRVTGRTEAKRKAFFRMRFGAGAILILVTACSCTRKGGTEMTQPEFAVEPQSASIDGMSVLAKLERSTSGDQWDATIVFSRAADQPPIPATDVDAQLLDAAGTPLKVLERPERALVEAGGSLGTSANARFRFEASKAEPATLAVTYRGQTVRFSVVGNRK